MWDCGKFLGVLICCLGIFMALFAIGYGAYLLHPIFCLVVVGIALAFIGAQIAAYCDEH